MTFDAHADADYIREQRAYWREEDAREREDQELETRERDRYELPSVRLPLLPQAGR